MFNLSALPSSDQASRDFGVRTYSVGDRPTELRKLFAKELGDSNLSSKAVAITDLP